MKIVIDQNHNYRCAYTDKVDGYMELMCSRDKNALQQNGYYRGNECLCKGFAPGNCTPCDIDSIDVEPTHCTLRAKGAQLQVALLLNNDFGVHRSITPQICLSGASDFQIFGIYSRFKKLPPDDDPNIVDIRKNKADKGAEKKEEEKQFFPQWRLDKADYYDTKNNEHKTVTILLGNLGISVFSEKPFDYEIIGDSSLDAFDIDIKGTLRIVNSSAPCYISFDRDQNEDFSYDPEFYGRLKRGDGSYYMNYYDNHCDFINEFFSRSNIDFGDDALNDSVKWAAFHAWMLCTKSRNENHYGLWAGLPWFRDNWGRDTFISLTGTLLVTGCFREARDVLLGFAEFQDLDTSSATFGRIPNRYRDNEDVIYNTADGTLFFIRALYEYISYSGDKDVILAHVKGGAIYDVVKRAIEADIKRCDEHGFLCCEDADTWMDARFKGDEALSPRGNRAVDIQALWYTALLIGNMFASRVGDTGAANYYIKRAKLLKESFWKYFCRDDYKMVSDHLLPGEYGQWAPDLRVRPNQLFAITAPAVCIVNDLTTCYNYKRMASEYNTTTSNKLKVIEPIDFIMSNVERELVTPYGLYTLSSQDPLFHAHHKTCEMHHKDAAYHNGTIWPWISGVYISAAKIYYGHLPKSAWNIIDNEKNLILNGSKGDNYCAGSLSENIHAMPNKDGSPILSGTFSQCWSLAEYLRNIYQDAFGFVPRFTSENMTLRATLLPSLPNGVNSAQATIPFSFCSVNITLNRCDDKYECTFSWTKNNRPIGIMPLMGDIEKISLIYSMDGRRVTSDCVKEKEELHIIIDAQDSNSYNHAENNIPVDRPLPDFLGSEYLKDYLMNLIKSGRMHSMCCAGENTAALEWYFDSKDFNYKYNTDEELGALYTPSSTTFKVWAPTASSVLLLLDYVDAQLVDWGDDMKAYRDLKDNSRNIIALKRGDRGVWSVTVNGDLHGKKYEYALMIHGVYNRCIDPYATACTNDGKTGIVYDRERTNPSLWNETKAPVIQSPCDAVIYELAIPDVTSSSTWGGSTEKRKTFMGAIEGGTMYKDMPTGFDYIKSLGVTHIQVLPVFDFSSVDDTGSRDQYNWGYDPRNYGCLKGFYSMDPNSPLVRISEFKEFVKKFSDAGIGVIMDVVFNHVSGGLHSALGVTVPGYYFRVEGYSGAGEDTASEHYMFRKYMIDMLKFWLTEYKLCGFRFDLMGLHDTTTMNAITSELRKIKPDVLIYGEGWDMYHAGKMAGASMCNARRMPYVSHFNDAVRCSIKGPCNDDRKPGFIHGGYYRDNIMAGVVGFTRHPQVDNSRVDLTANRGPWSDHSYTSMNYTEIHDNMTMMDKFQLVEPGRTESYYEQLAKMAISLVLLFEGIPVMQMGQEALRTKQIPVELLDKRGTFCSDQAEGADHRTFYVRNSYNAPDAINNIDWARIYDKRGLVEYIKLMIKLRRDHKAFRITDGDVISRVIKFIDNEDAHLPKEVVAWCIDGAAVGDAWHSIFIIANPKNDPVGYTLPINSVFTSGDEGTWRVATDGVMFCGRDCVVKVVDGAQFVMVQPKTVSVFYTV